MNRGRNADSIDRYLSGLMTPSEKSAFLLRLEREPELRRALDAEERITRTLLMDRASLPTAPAEGRVQMLDMLARQSVDASAPSGLLSGSWIGRLFGGTMIRGLAITVVGVSATIGIIRLGSSGEPLEPRSAPAASRPADAPVPRQSDAPAAAGSSVDAASGIRAGSVINDPAVASRSAAGTHGSAIERSASEGRERIQMRSGATQPAGQSARQPNGEQQAEPSIEHPTQVRVDETQPHAEPQEPVVITTDTMRVPVTIDLGGIRRTAPKP